MKARRNAGFFRAITLPNLGENHEKCVMNFFGLLTPKRKETGPKKKLFRFYKGYPVKSMRRAPEGIVINILSSTPGVPGGQFVITQEDWDRYGEKREVPSLRLDDIRKQFAKT